jgi:hypothetical protein
LFGGSLIRGAIAVSDFLMLSTAAAFGGLTWLLIVLCDRLMGGQR